MEYSELIMQRRSIRKYKEEPVDHDTLVSILKKAQLAPSWKNQQTSRCYVVESKEEIEELRREALPSFNQNNSAGAALIVTTYVRNIVGYTDGKPVNELGNRWGIYDLGLHDAYLILAAADAGLDTLIMGIRDAEAIRRVLSIPEEEDVVSVIAIGKRDQEPGTPKRKELNEVVKFL